MPSQKEAPAVAETAITTPAVTDFADISSEDWNSLTPEEKQELMDGTSSVRIFDKDTYLMIERKGKETGRLYTRSGQEKNYLEKGVFPEVVIFTMDQYWRAQFGSEDEGNLTFLKTDVVPVNSKFSEQFVNIYRTTQDGQSELVKSGVPVVNGVLDKKTAKSLGMKGTKRLHCLMKSEDGWNISNKVIISCKGYNYKQLIEVSTPELQRQVVRIIPFTRQEIMPGSNGSPEDVEVISYQLTGEQLSDDLQHTSYCLRVAHAKELANRLGNGEKYKEDPNEEVETAATLEDALAILGATEYGKV